MNTQYHHHRPYFPSQMKWESFKRKYTTLGFLLVFFREKRFLSLILHYFFNFHGPSPQNLYIRKSGMKKDCSTLLTPLYCYPDNWFEWKFIFRFRLWHLIPIKWADKYYDKKSLCWHCKKVYLQGTLLLDFFISKFYIYCTLWDLLEIRFLEIKKKAQKQNFQFNIRPGWLKKRYCL